jgi:hypothetical protein
MSALIEASEASSYDEAIEEWELNHVYICDKYGDENCICTHEIQEVCVVKNKINDNELHIGNCCINKFNIAGGKNTTKAISLLKKNKVNSSSINLWFELKMIDEWERDFLMQLRRTRLLTEKQHYYWNRILKGIKNSILKDDKYIEEWYEK